MSPSEQAEYEYEYERWIDLQDPTSIVSINAECQVVAFEQQRELQEYNDWQESELGVYLLNWDIN